MIINEKDTARGKSLVNHGLWFRIFSKVYKWIDPDTDEMKKQVRQNVKLELSRSPGYYKK